jgi:hypothetical protein
VKRFPKLPNFLRERLDLHKHFKNSFKGVKPFSWHSLLLLSLFSWAVYLLLREPALKQFVSVFAWIFLILGVDWALIEREGKEKKEEKEFAIPILGLQVRYSPWITGALICLALYSYKFLIHNTADALISWPIISVLVAAFPRFLKPGPKLKSVSELDASAKQDLVLLGLIGLLFSCWFQFHFQLQDVLRDYPSIQADNLSKSAFVVQVNRGAAPASSGVVMLDTAESLVRDELAKRTWTEGQQWLRSLQNQDQARQLNDRVKEKVFGNPPRLEESQFWSLLTPQVTAGIPDDRLQLKAFWRGPSYETNGYSLEKNCLIGAPPLQTITPPQATTGSYRMNCQPIISSTNGIKITSNNMVERGRNWLQESIRSLGRSLDRLFGGAG